MLTGLNEAFVIDEETKDKLISEDPESAELIKPFLAGKDIKRYVKPDAKKYIIMVQKGFTLQHCSSRKTAWKWFCDSYPSLGSHLQSFEAKAKKRFDQGDFWWELRACDYYQEFEKPKIIYAEIATIGQFYLDNKELFSDTTSYILISESFSLLGILNSKLWTYMFSNISSEIRGGYFRWKRQYMETLPIPEDPTDEKRKNDYLILREKIEYLVEEMLKTRDTYQNAREDFEKRMLNQKIEAIDTQIDAAVYQLYGLTADEIRIVEKSALKRQ